MSEHLDQLEPMMEPIDLLSDADFDELEAEARKNICAITRRPLTSTTSRGVSSSSQRPLCVLHSTLSSSSADDADARRAGRQHHRLRVRGHNPPSAHWRDAGGLQPVVPALPPQRVAAAALRVRPRFRQTVPAFNSDGASSAASSSRRPRAAARPLMASPVGSCGGAASSSAGPCGAHATRSRSSRAARHRCPSRRRATSLRARCAS